MFTYTFLLLFIQFNDVIFQSDCMKPQTMSVQYFSTKFGCGQILKTPIHHTRLILKHKLAFSKKNLCCRVKRYVYRYNVAVNTHSVKALRHVYQPT